MARLIRDSVLEVVEQGSGTTPRIVRIAPALVEGETSASRVVEGKATMADVVEGEVIHSPSRSGHMTWPERSIADELVATFGSFSGHIEATRNELVATLSDVSGHSHVPVSSENAEKGLNQGSGTSRVEQVLDDASSAADAAGAVEAREPPAMDPRILDELERRGLRPKPRPGPKPEQQPRSRDEQLAILERITAEDEAKAKNGQEGKEPA